MSLGSKYRQVVKKQHELMRGPCEKLSQFALFILVASIVLFLLVGAAGIALSFKMNEDTADVMAPTGTVYNQR